MNSHISKPNQSSVFLGGEADQWYLRNKAPISSKQSFFETETIKRVLLPFKPSINSILEIGCCDGVKLEDLSDFFMANAHGVDPSSLAISEGNTRLAKLHKPILLKAGTSSSLPYKNEQFDLVFFGFCLYLVDRKDLFSTIAEADRVLRSGGFLAILDFDPHERQKREYHHKPGIFSFKASYPNFFISSGHYSLVSKDSYSHSAPIFSEESGERISISIMYKEPDPYKSAI